MCTLNIVDHSPSEELSEGVIHTPKPSGGIKKAYSPCSTPSMSVVDKKENNLYKRSSLQPLILHRKDTYCMFDCIDYIIGTSSPETDQTV